MKALNCVGKPFLINLVRELVTRICVELTEGYDTMHEFKAAVDAGKIPSYTTKTPEERDRDLLGMPPGTAL